MSGKLSKLPQFTLNLRYLAKSNFPGSLPEQWSRLLATQTGILDRRVVALLHGEAPDQSDLDKVAAAFGREAAVLGSAPLYGHEGETILTENLRHLLNSLPKGEKSRLAKSIGVRQEQFSRWEKEVRPERKNLEKMLEFFGLNPRLDLVVEPLFLSLDPVGAHAQKEWLAKRVQSASPSEIGRLFEAFKRLLPPNAPD